MPVPIDFQNAAAAMTAAAAASGSDYKALVCVFLNGANDCHNTVVPVGAAYAQYQTDRTSAQAIPSANVLSLTATPNCGLHPSLTGLRTIYNAGDAAILCNVGPLVQPMDKTDFGSEFSAGPGIRPYLLFSHEDQQNVWYTSRPDTANEATGFLGRIADLYEPAFNPSQAVPSVLSPGQRLRILQSNDRLSYQIQRSLGTGDIASPFVQQNGSFSGPTNASINASIADWNASGRGHLLEGEFVASMQRALDYYTLAVTAGGATALATTFPDTPMSRQLYSIARMIRGRASLNHRRQVFFATISGFDTHSGDSLATNAALLTEVDGAIKAFYDEMVSQGLSSNVTLFTASDFGRALAPNGSGTDHGWGGHHFIVGGAVNGGRLFNRDAKNGAILNTFPDITIGGPWDAGQGRLIPQISCSEYGSTLAKWFGIPDALSNGVNPMNLAFPLAPAFAARDLGFMT